jgi:ABC-2 type transport system permease protein
MSRLLAAEWIKLRKRWMVYILTIIMLAIIGLVFWGIGTTSNRVDLIFPRGWIVALFLATGFAGFLWPVLGGSWAGNEYGWGTVRMILSRKPDRIQWVLAALTMLIITAGFALIATLVVATIGGIIVATLTNHSLTVSDLQSNYPLIMLKSFLGSWYILAFYLIMAYAAGTIFRSAAVGIGAGIGFTVAQLIVFGIFQSLGGHWKDIALHFPYSYTNSLSNRLAAAGTVGNFTDTTTSSPGIGECLIGLAIYLAIFLAVTLYLVRTRDVTS